MLTAFVRVSRFVGWSVCSAAAALALTVSLSTLEAAAADDVVSEIEPGLYLFESGRVGMKPVADHPDDPAVADTDPEEIEQILGQLADPLGTFYRFSLADSLLPPACS